MYHLLSLAFAALSLEKEQPRLRSRAAHDALGCLKNILYGYRLQACEILYAIMRDALDAAYGFM
jgi:hypothetical protein